MFKLYVIEKQSWIFFFLFIQLLSVFIAFIDTSIPLRSMMYIVFLSVISFLVFLICRFQKETQFYKSLIERESNLDITGMAKAKTPFQEIVADSITIQTGVMEQVASENLTTLEQEKDELLTWIHEVKTPLTAMHLMIDRLDNEPIKANLTYEWLRIHLLLDQQLHQKRIAFIENDLYIEKIVLEEIIFQEIKTLQSWCIQKGLGFDVDLKIATLESDAKWLAFILRQLLTNAVKYSQDSDITIRSYSQAGQTILEVQDYGRGIDPKDIARIFDKGFTSTTNHQDNAATGMGLYLLKKVAVELKIVVDVNSSLGKGTIFTLTFPKLNEFVSITGM
ncbi:sensor histidine kinase [Paraliobacillus sediminis]|uniref:sensor histidine kinase n=1 Tax=Paraliobacillus sediminis TaxID=1885916 RepID=UPI000E3DF7CD|nr:sensor histidine kinase [Paraliobacillus sediminis]